MSESTNTGGSGCVDPNVFPDMTLLLGPKKCGKSRLLVQLAYSFVSRSSASGNDGVSGGVRVSVGSDRDREPDPLQTVVLILPRRRQFGQVMNDAGSSGNATSCSGSGVSASQSQSKAIFGLFGREAEELNLREVNKIKIKWYGDDADLMKIVCSLQLLSPAATHASNATKQSSVVNPSDDVPSTLGELESSSTLLPPPPCLIALMYDSVLSTDASRVAMLMARYAEAIATINSNHEQSTGAPCKGVFCMSLSSNPSDRLPHFLPRFARCVFEVTPGNRPGISWQLHSRPMVSLLQCPMPVYNRLITPMPDLHHASKQTHIQQDQQQQQHSTIDAYTAAYGDPNPPPPPRRRLSLAPFPGMPVIGYDISPHAINIVDIQV